jgi:hypothetical protein
VLGTKSVRRLSALERLVQGLWAAPHDYRPSLQVFPDISVDVLARLLDLGARGEQRGKEDEPATKSATIDEVEHSIIERIYAERKAAYQLLVDELETYSHRLGALDFEGRFATIQHAAPEAVGEFKAEAIQGRDRLYQLRRTLVENESERDAFRNRHHLVRAPRLSGAIETFLKVALLFFLFVVETYINGAFLAKGNELGFLGGVVEALVFAVLNLVVSFFLGLLGVRQINSTGFVRRFLGLLSIACWMVFAVGLNLALAHYREISGVIYEDAGAQVLKRLLASPAGLMDIKSWLFFALGFVFSAAALLDGIFFTDPCPGYADLERRVLRAHDNYIENKDELIALLRAIREDATLKMEEAQRDLGKRRGEHDSILAGRSRLLGLFDQHQEQLQRTGDALLAIYRSANRQARASAAPARFEQPWVMDRIKVDAALPGPLLRKNLDEEIKSMQDLLKTEIVAIQRAFDEAVESYRQIDDLVPEKPYGPSPCQVA